MKKKICLVVAMLLTLSMLMAACGGGSTATPAPTEAPAAPTEAPAPAPTEEAAAPSPEATKTYKELMLPFDQLTYSNRIVILQNTLRYILDGFYTEADQPVAEEIEYNGEKVSALPITYTLNFLTLGSAGTVAVTDAEGAVTEMPAEEFAGMYVIIDFTSDAAPVFYNPTTGAEINFAYAVTSEGEAIYSIVSGSSHNVLELIKTVGWDETQTYRVVAVDKFYIPVAQADSEVGEFRGTLSGAINGSFPGLKVAGGKINDVMYVEQIVE